MLIIAWLAALSLSPIDHAKPPRPTDAQLVAALVSVRPGVEITRQAGRDVFDGAGRAICGVARIEGQVEPFSVVTMWGPSWIPVEAGVARADPVRGPDHWIVLATAPAQRDRDGILPIGSTRQRQDALARKQTLSLCNGLAVPDDVIWITDYH